jgi:hypothetical protein
MATIILSPGCFPAYKGNDSPVNPIPTPAMAPFLMKSLRCIMMYFEDEAMPES